MIHTFYPYQLRTYKVLLCLVDSATSSLFSLIHRLPFEWKTPHGYLMALLVESIMAFTVGSIIVPPVCFFIGSYFHRQIYLITNLHRSLYFIGSCFIIMAFVSDIAPVILHLNINRRSSGKHREIKKHFYNIIEDVSDAKQLSVKLVMS